MPKQRALAPDYGRSGVARDPEPGALEQRRLLGSLGSTTSSSNISYTVADLGPRATRSGTFVFTVATSTVGAIVEAFDVPITSPTGEGADRLEMDPITLSGVVTDPISATVYWNSGTNYVSGTRTVAFRVLTIA